ncbi:hypothetical protein RhiJN_19714 [Ceratobasidium sp. AG-Ba]|nr:hypothetical protein RhiJN_04884 [Ceratobasidium sp. AG-Ba]QRV91696.1 hypothetical protein RhiJN_19714 [Ceratobasidium sp. AG-Ba]
MFLFTRAVFIATVLGLSAAALVPRQVNQNQGQPVSAGRPVDRSSEAGKTFGTTKDDVNWQKLPTGLCIVPEYQNEAGLNKDKKPLTVQQAMEICPRAARIVVHQD